MAKYKTILLMLIIFLLAAGAGVGGYLYLNHEKTVDYELKTIRIDDMMTNLAQGPMIKISLSVVVNQEINSDNHTDQVLRDAIVSYLRTVEKANLEGVTGLDYLKSNLVSASRHALGVENVKEIYIREFIVQ